MKILVIDDEKPTLAMFKLFLTAYGYEVVTAEDGEKGMALFIEIKPEIVFTDIRMPGMDGLEVLRQIRKTGIPSEVIIITGHGDMEKAVEALDWNASDFINKPVERQALDSALLRAEKRRQMPGQTPVTFSGTGQEQAYQVQVKGRLTAAATKELSALFSLSALESVTTVSLIFDDGFSIDRSGISLLMETLQALKQKKKEVIMTGLSYNYVQVFKMAGMDKLASLTPNVSDPTI